MVDRPEVSDVPVCRILKQQKARCRRGIYSPHHRRVGSIRDAFSKWRGCALQLIGRSTLFTFKVPSLSVSGSRNQLVPFASKTISIVFDPCFGNNTSSL